jgi:hypothetical protein
VSVRHYPERKELIIVLATVSQLKTLAPNVNDPEVRTRAGRVDAERECAIILVGFARLSHPYYKPTMGGRCIGTLGWTQRLTKLVDAF